jgi:hypothetical protein
MNEHSREATGFAGLARGRNGRPADEDCVAPEQQGPADAAATSGNKEIPKARTDAIRQCRGPPQHLREETP